MHFALPPRKSSFPPPYARASARTTSNLKRKQLQLLGYIVLGLLTILLVARWAWHRVSTTDDEAVSRHSSVLIVTVLDESNMSEDYMRMVKANREDYAARHGYKTFYTNTTTYSSLTDPAPSSWSLVPALRHALTLNPEVDYVWSLTPDAMITNITLDLYTHILQPLPSLMQKDIPVVPPDSVIHTFSHLRPSQAYIILSQDMDNIAHTSFLLRNTKTIPVPSHNHPKDTWTNYFLDAWFDPLYRAYSFQKAENHALEHIVQWHPTILAKVVMIEQRRFNSYNFQPSNAEDPDTHAVRSHDSMWQPGDLLVNFKGCMDTEERDCESEMRTYFAKWMTQVEKIDGKGPAVELAISDAEYDPERDGKRRKKPTDSKSKDGKQHI